MPKKEKATAQSNKERSVRKRVHELFSEEDLPFESFGACRNAVKKTNGRFIGCRQYHVILGDGLCVKCWDARASTTGLAKKIKEDIDDAKA